MNPRLRPAMTLVEVLAALALIGAVGAALNRAWIVTMATAARSTAEITAATLAENKLAETVAAGVAAGADDSGQFEPPNENYRWQCRRNAWTQDSRLIRIDVTVSWTRRNNPCEITVSTLAREATP